MNGVPWSWLLALGSLAADPAGATGRWVWVSGLVLGLLAGLWWLRSPAARRSARTFWEYRRPGRLARGYLGVIQPGVALRPEENQRCQHMLVEARTPAEVAERYVQPNLLLDAHEGVSVVMFDLGAEAPADLRPLLPAFVPGHDVQVFAPYEPFTLHFPLLAGIRSEDDAAGLAAALIPGSAAGAPLALRAERALLEGLLLDGGLRSGGLGDLLALARAGPDALSVHLAQAARPARQRTHLYFSLRHEQQTSLASALARTLAAFGDGAVDRATRSAERPGAELDLAGALTRPAAVYLRLPPAVAGTESGRALLRALRHTVLRTLRQAGTQTGGAPPQHVSVYLPGPLEGDTPLPDLAPDLAALRLTRVACHLVRRPDPSPRARPETGLVGHTLRLGAPPHRPAELWLADGRHTRVWLPGPRERRLGPVSNPLFGAWRRLRAVAAPEGLDLTRDLVLRHQLADRAERVARTPGGQDAKLLEAAFLEWIDRRIHAGPSGAPQDAPQAQAERWVGQGWLASAGPHAPPVLTRGGLELLGPDRERAWAALPPTVLPAPSPLPPRPEPQDQEVENPVLARHSRLLALLAQHRDLTPAQFVALTDLPETTVRRDLGILEASGQVRSTRTAGKRYFRLVSAQGAEDRNDAATRQHDD
ncbi:DeoR family transcriptional regulator [Deinococcus planocerae]|uniref:DeoR family transcriptional regulator n=1 Tax=Deinococcus planocerae TaxID=1737569 RepID=UPI000C7F3573|nr:DeoR family transcriptional regulator [Deinococcus planocerae]